MCVVPAVRRGAAYAAFCGTGTGLPCAPPYKALRHSGIQVLHSPAARRVPRRVPCREPRREPRRVPRRAPPPPRRMHAAAPVRTTPNMWQPWLDAGRKLIRSGVSLLAPPFVRNVQCCNIWSRQIHTAPLLLPADTDWTVISVRRFNVWKYSTIVVCIWQDQILQHCTFQTKGGASREMPNRMSFLPASSHGCQMFSVILQVFELSYYKLCRLWPMTGFHGI